MVDVNNLYNPAYENDNWLYEEFHKKVLKTYEGKDWELDLHRLPALTIGYTFLFMWGDPQAWRDEWDEETEEGETNIERARLCAWNEESM